MKTHDYMPEMNQKRHAARTQNGPVGAKSSGARRARWCECNKIRYGQSLVATFNDDSSVQPSVKRRFKHLDYLLDAFLGNGVSSEDE